MMDKIEGTVRTFILSFLKAGLYAILAISIIGIMGVPMASVVAVLASAGVAIGLALQGALSNLAGGIILMIFKPFHQGDYVSAAGVEGVVKEVTLFYTVILTLDNKRITVPNGSLMNANITDYSAEELRRVDLRFACAKSEAPAKIQDMPQDHVYPDHSHPVRTNDRDLLHRQHCADPYCYDEQPRMGQHRDKLPQGSFRSGIPRLPHHDLRRYLRRTHQQHDHCSQHSLGSLLGGSLHGHPMLLAVQDRKPLEVVVQCTLRRSG